MASPRKPSLWQRFKLPLKILGVFLGIAAGLAVFVLLSQLGPNNGLFNFGLAREEVPQDLTRATELAERSEGLQRQFEDTLLIRDVPSDEDIELIQEAIALLEEAQELSGTSSLAYRDRLRQMREAYHNAAARFPKAESERLEAEALEAEVTGDTAKALAHLKEAIVLQRRINEQYSLAHAVDVRRMGRLERRARTLEATPLHEDARSLERQAREAIEAEAWTDAERFLTEAISVQRDLNMRFRGIAFANVQKLSELESELASLRSNTEAEEIEALKEEARRRAAEGQHLAASELYHQAWKLQEQLNADYPNSRFASEERVDELLELTRQARSYGTANEIADAVARMDRLLAQRKVWEALEGIRPLAQKAKVFAERFPEHSVVNAELLGKLEFLARNANDVAFFHDRIYGALEPVPGSPAVRMLRTEVSQALYTSVTQTNPSRNTGEQLPVDSVTYEEAESFAQKVSWLLGLPTRLPERSEYERAVGSLRYVDLRLHAWSVENADGDSKPVASKEPNAQGFYDLLGNVAEWVRPTGMLSPNEAYAAGGSVADDLDRLADVPFRAQSQRSRAINLGFRFVVDFSSAPAPTGDAAATRPSSENPEAG